jgi:hypothetical protein
VRRKKTLQLAAGAVGRGVVDQQQLVAAVLEPLEARDARRGLCQAVVVQDEDVDFGLDRVLPVRAGST